MSDEHLKMMAGLLRTTHSVLNMKEMSTRWTWGAERLIAAEKGTEKIVVEIKSFLRTSVVYQFHDALGKYMNYLVGLQLANETERRLFLAISHPVYIRLSESPLLMASVETYKVNIMVFDANKPEVLSWIKF